MGFVWGFLKVLEWIGFLCRGLGVCMLRFVVNGFEGVLFGFSI